MTSTDHDHEDRIIDWFLNQTTSEYYQSEVVRQAMLARQLAAAREPYPYTDFGHWICYIGYVREHEAATCGERDLMALIEKIDYDYERLDLPYMAQRFIAARPEVTL